MAARWRSSLCETDFTEVPFPGSKSASKVIDYHSVAPDLEKLQGLARDERCVALVIDGDSPYLRLGNPKETHVIQLADLRKLLAEKHTIIIDVDDRKEFAENHITRSINIPEDELYSRALNELPEPVSIVLFSRRLDAHKIRNAEMVLRSLGFAEVEWLKVTLEEAQRANF